MTAVLRNWTFAILWLFTLTIPWEAAVEELPWVGTLSRTIGLLAVPVAVLALAVGGRRRRLLDTHVIMLVLAGWTLVSVAWSIGPDVTLQTAATMFQLVAMTLMLWEFMRESRRHRQLLWAFVGGAFIGSIAIFFGAPTSSDVVTTQYVRVSQGGVNANYAALVFSLAIPVAWHLSLTSPGLLQRWIAGLYVPTAAVAVVLTGSRGGLVTLLLALSIVLLTLHISDLRLKVFALISLPLSIVVIANFVPTQTIDRLETIPTELATGTLGERSQAWEASWEIFAAHPVLGVGAGASRFRIEPRLGREQGPHNTYLSIGADLGTVGLGLFLLLLLSVAARWLSLQGRERQVVGVLLITLMVGLLPGHLEYRKVTWVVIAIIISEAARAQRTALYRLPARKVSIP